MKPKITWTAEIGGNDPSRYIEAKADYLDRLYSFRCDLTGYNARAIKRVRIDGTETAIKRPEEVAPELEAAMRDYLQCHS